MMFETRVMGLLALAVVGLAQPAGAQQRVEPVDSLRVIQSISPRSGPVGTQVEVYSDNMPLEAKFHVGVGATRSGFESLYEATQVALGEIAVTLPIPSAVTSDRAIVFVAFNAVFSPIAMSRPFHVTDERGRLQRTGQVESTDGECISFSDEDGFAYELVGSVGGLQAGAEVVLDAEYVAESDCVDGATIRVRNVTPSRS
ncbi:MAG: hypothetical protein WD995_09990 [Gemmatimonadota bacterium]